MTSHAEDFRQFVLSHPVEKQGDGQIFSGSSRKHYGLSNPTMRQFLKDWVQTHPALSYDDWQDTLSALYQGDSIDEACLAGFMFGHFKQFRQQLSLDVLDAWLGHLEGWREIDTTCQSNINAKEMLSRWEDWKPFLLELAQHETIQHRRAGLVLLIKPVRESGDERLITTALANVDVLKHETDKLITKAVSWILRESIKQHRQRVGQYVEENAGSLPAIAVREFRKKYTSGKK